MSPTVACVVFLLAVLLMVVIIENLDELFIKIIEIDVNEHKDIMNKLHWCLFSTRTLLILIILTFIYSAYKLFN